MGTLNSGWAAARRVTWGRGWGALGLLILATSAVDAQQPIPRIINGTPTDGFEAVGVVGSWEMGGFCSGTLITPYHVLTAAHCAEMIDDAQSGTFEVAGEIYGTVGIYIHPEYNSRSLANDIAILELSEPVENVVPYEIFRGTPVAGDELTLVGFGSLGTPESGSDGSFGTKTFGTTTIDEVLRSQIVWQFDSVEESNPASGDSGGPGFIDIGGALLIASITSYGTRVDAGLGDVTTSTRVDAFADWIDAVVSATGGGGDDSDGDTEPGDTDGEDGETGEDGENPPDDEPVDDGHRHECLVDGTQQTGHHHRQPESAWRDSRRPAASWAKGNSRRGPHGTFRQLGRPATRFSRTAPLPPRSGQARSVALGHAHSASRANR